eukprot:COSAG05_NODE_846_length_6998_cov_2.530077_6_plen_184_part_00
MRAFHGYVIFWFWAFVWDLAASLRAMLQERQVDVPAGASRDSLAALLQSHSEGKAATIARWPEHSEDKERLRKRGKDSTSVSTARDIGMKAAVGCLHKCRRGGSKALLMAMGGEDQQDERPPTTWLELHHPSTGNASRGRVEICCEVRPPPLYLSWMPLAYPWGIQVESIELDAPPLSSAHLT